MKKRFIFAGIVLVVLLAIVVATIRTINGRHFTQDVNVLSGVAKKMVIWSMDNNEKYPSMTNSSFLATLSPDESVFVRTHRITAPTEHLSLSSLSESALLRAETKHGRLTLHVDGSVSVER